MKHSTTDNDLLNEVEQKLLERSIYEQSYQEIFERINSKTDIFAFPKYELKTTFPSFLPGLNYTPWQNANPGDINLAGLLLFFDAHSASNFLEKMMKGHFFNDVPIVIDGIEPVNLLKVISEPRLLLNWIRLLQKEQILETYQSVFDALDFSSTSIRQQLSDLAISVLATCRHKNFSQQIKPTHSTVGFSIFANLVLAGIEIPKDIFLLNTYESGEDVPLLFSAVQYDLYNPNGSVLLEKLIDLGATVDSVSLSGQRTLLMHACAIGAVSATQILLANGADLTRRDSRQWSAHSYAKKLTKIKQSKGNTIITLLDAELARRSIRKLFLNQKCFFPKGVIA